MSLPLPPGARLPARAVWLNGRLVRGEEAALSLWDLGARGAALFETLRMYGGRPFAWNAHLERLVLASAELGFPVPPSPVELREAVAQVLEAEQLTDAVVRITVSRGVPGGRPVRAGAWVEAEPLLPRLWAGTRRLVSGGASAGGELPAGGTAMLSQNRIAPGRLGRYKTTSRLAWDLARDEARIAGADEALLVTPAGEVLEGAASNVFVVRNDGVVITPPLDADILPGVTRAIVIRLARGLGLDVREEPIRADALARASEVFLTNSVQEVVPLARVEDRPLAARAVGLRLLAAYRETVATD